MLRRINNPNKEPVFLFYHNGTLYYAVGGAHHQHLEQVSVVTADSAGGTERAQAFLFDSAQARYCKEWARDWFVVECVRKETTRWAADSENEWSHTRAYL